MRIVVNKNDALVFSLIIAFFLMEILTGVPSKMFLGISIALLVLYLMRNKQNVWLIAFLVLLLQKALQRVSTGIIYQGITYLDEVAEVLMFCYILRVVIRGKICYSSKERNIIACYIIYIIFCILSSINDYSDIHVKVLDCFVCMKFMIFYIGGLTLARYSGITREKVYSRLNSACKIISIILLILVVHDLIFPAFFEKFDFRYFTYSLQLCFQHPTYLAVVCLTCMAVLILNMKYDNNNFKYIVFLSITTFLTFRTKAMAAVLITWAIYFVYIKFQLPMKKLILLGVTGVALYFGLDQFKIYFTEGDSVPIRLKMMKDGINIAQQHFPLGSGFGTFGTTVAYDMKSSFYYELGYMSGYYENQPVGDVFWPGIFSQAGWIGTVFFASCIVIMLLDSLDRIKKDKFAGWCMLSILAYAIVASTAETAFFNPATAFMFIIYGIAANRGRSRQLSTA